MPRIASEVQVLATPDELARTVARHLSLAAQDAVDQRGRFTLALAGGSTPLRLYKMLGGPMRHAIPWKDTLLFWGDERLVPHNHSDSNYRAVRDALLHSVPVLPEHVYPIPVDEMDAKTAAERYEQTLREHFSEELDGFSFDVVLLGIGKDGHTASLFPGTAAAAVSDPESWTAPAEAPPGTAVRDRVTLTLPLINRARQVFLLVAGEEKREALRRILVEQEDLPAARVSARQRLVWFIEQSAHP